MQSWINSQDAWPIWGILVSGGALCIYLEQTYKWAARMSGPVLALLGGLALSNPLLVADNFIMAGMFGLLFLIANSKFFRTHYPHPHSQESDRGGSQALAARHWERKGIALLDIAKALAVAFAITALSMKITESLNAGALSPWIRSILGNAYL